MIAYRNAWLIEDINVHRLIESVDSTDQLNFPVCIDHRDQASPDFVLSTRTRQIGLEVTSATDEELIRGRHISRSLQAPFIDVTHLRDGDARRPNEALSVSMRDINGEWADSNEVLLHKLTKISLAVERKQAKLHSPNFEHFTENWLLLYDDYFRFSGSADVNYFMLGLRNNLGQLSAGFDRIYFFCSSFAYRWRDGKLSVKRVHA